MPRCTRQSQGADLCDVCVPRTRWQVWLPSPLASLLSPYQFSLSRRLPTSRRRWLFESGSAHADQNSRVYQGRRQTVPTTVHTISPYIWIPVRHASGDRRRAKDFQSRSCRDRPTGFALESGGIYVGAKQATRGSFARVFLPLNDLGTGR
jgi:hypothetical protein